MAGSASSSGKMAAPTLAVIERVLAAVLQRAGAAAPSRLSLGRARSA